MRWTRAAVAAAVILAATWLQMVIGVTVGVEAFNGKGFLGRILIYPVLMLALPAWWWWRHRGTDAETPRPAHRGHRGRGHGRDRGRSDAPVCSRSQCARCVGGDHYS